MRIMSVIMLTLQETESDCTHLSKQKLKATTSFTKFIHNSVHEFFLFLAIVFSVYTHHAQSG